jgi:hypothetical protein
MADAPKGYFQVPGVDTSIQLYGNACFDLVYDGVQPGGVMQGLSAANQSFTDNASPKSQWDMTMDESRFGMRTFTPTSIGDVKTRFELDFLGTNKDHAGGRMPWASSINGETSNYGHVRQMYGEWNGWLFGKADNNFEDPDGSPNYLDWDGLLGDWYGCGRDLQVRYTASFDAKTTLAVAIERNDGNTIGGTNPIYPQGKTINPGVTANTSIGSAHSLPGDLTARLTYADKWGHIAFAGAFTKYEQFASQAYTAATTQVVANPATYTLGVPAYLAVAGSTASYSKNVFSWAVSGHFQFGDDALTYHGGIGTGQWGAGLQDGVNFDKAGNLQTIQAKQFEAGYEHFFTAKLHGNVFVSYVGYDRDIDKGMTGNAFKTYEQYGANMIYNATKTMQYGLEYIYGQAKTFDANTLINPDGSTASSIGESKLHFQAKFKFN